MNWKKWFTANPAPTAVPPQPPLAADVALVCDESVTDPVRIRQLLDQCAQHQANVILLGRELVPVVGHFLPTGACRLRLRNTGRAQALPDTVTVMTRINGIDLFFSSRAHATNPDTWEVDTPTELLYMNLRGYFRVHGQAEDQVVLRMASGKALKAGLVNLSESGLCVALSPLEAQLVWFSGIGLRCDLTLAGRTWTLNAMGMSHHTEVDGRTHVGLSFHLAEGASRQTLRTVLNQRQVKQFNNKKSYERLSEMESSLSSL